MKSFGNAGWQIGVIFPRHLAEAQWLAWDKSNGAKLLVTGNDTWITVIILAGDEPVMVDRSSATRMVEPTRYIALFSIIATACQIRLQNR